MAVNRKRKSRKKTVYQVKKGAQSAAYGFLSAFGIFMTIIFIAAFFILFQWKGVRISSCLKNIDKLEIEIMKLKSQNIYLETHRNDLIKEVPEKAEKLLGMTIPIETGNKIAVSQNRMAYYESKDKTLPK